MLSRNYMSAYTVKGRVRAVAPRAKKTVRVATRKKPGARKRAVKK